MWAFYRHSSGWTNSELLSSTPNHCEETTYRVHNLGIGTNTLYWYRCITNFKLVATDNCFSLFQLMGDFFPLWSGVWQVRDEELEELDQLLCNYCELPAAGGVENSYGKINILLQTYISRGEVDSFSLISDLSYVAQVRKSQPSIDSPAHPGPGQMVILFHAEIPAHLFRGTTWGFWEKNNTVQWLYFAKSLHTKVTWDCDALAAPHTCFKI